MARLTQKPGQEAGGCAKDISNVAEKAALLSVGIIHSRLLAAGRDAAREEEIVERLLSGGCQDDERAALEKELKLRPALSDTALTAYAKALMQVRAAAGEEETGAPAVEIKLAKEIEEYAG